MENTSVKIAQVFQTLLAVLEKPNTEIKFKTLTHASIRKQIEDTQMLLKMVDSSWSELPTSKLESLYDRARLRLKSEPALTKSLGSLTTSFIIDMPGMLKGRANGLGVIKAIAESNKIINRLMVDLEDNLSKIALDDKGIIINDVKVSHGMFLGVLQASKVFAEFNCYFLAVLGHITTTKTGVIDMPRYMSGYIGDHGSQYINLVNHLCNVSVRYSIINEITGIREKGLDFKFGIRADNAHVRGIFSVLGVDNIFLTFFSLFIRPIALIGEVYVDMRHSYYQSIKEKKKWLESHVALIKMETEGVDPNSAEYVKIQKVISFYEDRISELDKKVQTYAD